MTEKRLFRPSPIRIIRYSESDDGKNIALGRGLDDLARGSDVIALYDCDNTLRLTDNDEPSVLRHINDSDYHLPTTHYYYKLKRSPEFIQLAIQPSFDHKKVHRASRPRLEANKALRDIQRNFTSNGLQQSVAVVTGRALGEAKVTREQLDQDFSFSNQRISIDHLYPNPGASPAEWKGYVAFWLQQLRYDHSFFPFFVDDDLVAAHMVALSGPLPSFLLWRPEYDEYYKKRPDEEMLPNIIPIPSLFVLPKIIDAWRQSKFDIYNPRFQNTVNQIIWTGDGGECKPPFCLNHKKVIA